MQTGGFLGADRIPHFDGGLFDDDEVLELDAEGLRILTADFSVIDPYCIMLAHSRA